ncbi:MAG: hypothetical protein PF487_14740 [Bacteroidales bacterium]|jgi:hypothetical protein|nr:hypothetical protein [Bacteroidales bacterium]
MNINELFEAIQDNFHPEELNGEFLLHENVIIWSCNINETSKEFNYLNDYDEEEIINFEISSSEEILQENYQEDFNKLQEFLDIIEQTDKWSCSDNEITDNTIIFNLY